MRSPFWRDPFTADPPKPPPDGPGKVVETFEVRTPGPDLPVGVCGGCGEIAEADHGSDVNGYGHTVSAHNSGCSPEDGCQYPCPVPVACGPIVPGLPRSIGIYDPRADIVDDVTLIGYSRGEITYSPGGGDEPRTLPASDPRIVIP